MSHPYDKHGGPAFPANASETGMQLRDYFAAQVLIAIVPPTSQFTPNSESVARRAYEIADAMLKERAK